MGLENELELMKPFGVPSDEEMLAARKLEAWTEFALAALKTSPFVFDCKQRQFNPREVTDIAGIMLHEWDEKRKTLLKDCEPKGVA